MGVFLPDTTFISSRADARSCFPYLNGFDEFPPDRFTLKKIPFAADNPPAGG